jgi:hypothetical protein
MVVAGGYCLASFTHFFHNAEFCGEYPNLPEWISRWSVYASWVAITALGGAGFRLAHGRHPAIGLVLVAIYAALGFDGLGHYAFAPVSSHSFAMNLTIWFEVVAAGVLFACTLRALVAELRVIGVKAKIPNE